MFQPRDEAMALVMRAPTEAADWPAYIAEFDSDEIGQMPELIKQYAVSVKCEEIADVGVRTVSPSEFSPGRRDWLLIHWHGGAYVAGAGTAGLREAVLMAHHAKAKVISVDYRMPPLHPFPGAIDDGVAVWRSLCKTHDPANVAFFGTSAGGALSLATALAARDADLPLPAAIAASTPWSDLTETGDTYETNKYIDGAVPFYAGLLERAARLYAGPDNLRHPLASPVYADLGGLPPTILCSGTRDLFLSCTVRMHRALRNVDVVAALHVFEGISHGQLCGLPDAPESLEAFAEIVDFFQEQLGREGRLHCSAMNNMPN